MFELPRTATRAAMAQEPMIKLEPGGTAPILSYNVPEPTTYTGRNITELEFADTVYSAAARTIPAPPAPPPAGTPTPPRVGGAGGLVFVPRLSARETAAASTAAPAATPAPAAAPRLAASARVPFIKNLDSTEVATKVAAGYRLARYTDLNGEPAVRVLPPVPPTPRPRLLLVEVCRLSSYLGAYGAGRVLKTFTLLPGEKTKVSVKTYTRRTEDAKAASSILDSFTQESADDFENAMSAEQSDKTSESENFEYHAEAEASASWGWGSAKVSGGVKGGTTAAREEFAKNVSSATQKHSAKSSAKRDVQVNTSTEVKEESGEETAIERTIENVNLSRTLNFVFRQMNQQFVTILQLVDVRVAFFNGHPSSAREVALSQLDQLLEDVIVPAERAAVRAAILNQVQGIRDHEGTTHPFIEEIALSPTDTYLRVRRDLVFSYTEPVTGQQISFTGIPLAVDKYTMRTEGVIVEAMLGQASALDAYAEELQQLEVVRRQAEVAKLRAEAERAALINTLASARDLEAAKALAEMTRPADPAPKDVKP